MTNIATNASGQLANSSTEAEGRLGGGAIYDPVSNSVVLTSYATNLVPHPSFVGGYPGSDHAMYLKNLTTGAVSQVDVEATGRQISQRHDCSAGALAPGAGRVLLTCLGRQIASGGTSLRGLALYLHQLSTGSWKLVSTDANGRALTTFQNLGAVLADWRRVLLTTLPGLSYRDGVKNLRNGAWHPLPTLQGDPTPDWSRAAYDFASSKTHGNEYAVSTLAGARRQVVTRNAQGALVNNGAFDLKFAKGGRLLYFLASSLPGQVLNLPGGRTGYAGIYVESSPN